MAEPATPPGCATSYGIWPPARKLAVCPLTVVRLGSASRVIRPSVARAEIVAWTAPATSLPISKTVVAGVVTPLLVENVTELLTDGTFSQLMPSSFTMLRSTSAILTRRLTWFGVATVSRLMTLPLDLGGDRGGKRLRLFRLAGIGDHTGQHQIGAGGVGRDRRSGRHLLQ